MFFILDFHQLDALSLNNDTCPKLPDYSFLIVKLTRTMLKKIKVKIPTYFLSPAPHC